MLLMGGCLLSFCLHNIIDPRYNLGPSINVHGQQACSPQQATQFQLFISSKWSLSCVQSLIIRVKGFEKLLTLSISNNDVACCSKHY